MRATILVASFLSIGNASAEEWPAADAALQAAKDGKPACESGHPAALKGGVVTIKSGETICVELRLNGNSVSPVAIVSEADESTTLVLKAWNEAGKPDTFLTIHNPLNVFLRYQAHMLVPGHTQIEYTSSCPVMAGRFGLEHWPYPIQELRLANFSVEPESTTIECR